MNSYSAYPAAAAEERSRVKNTQTRIYSIVGVVCLCLLCILVGVLVPVLLLQQRDARRGRDASEAEAAAAVFWAGVFRNAVTSTITVAYTLNGFIVGNMRTLPVLTGTPKERTRGQYFPRFTDLAKLLNERSEDLGALATAPGGVVYQTFPKTDALYMYDMMFNYTDPLLGGPNLDQNLEKRETILFGPRYRSSPEMAAEHGRWDIDVIQPVHNSTEDFTRNDPNFWGYACAVLSITAIVEKMKLLDWMEQHNLAFLMYTYNITGLDNNTIVPMYSTYPQDSSQEFFREFVSVAQSRRILFSKMNWTIAVHRSFRYKYLSRVNIAIIVSTVVGGSLVIFLIALAVILTLTREYDGRRHVPKRPPFAILIIGPCHGNELWNLASEQMIEVTERLNMILSQKMVSNHAYPTMQLHPYTNSYITRTVEGAVRMAFDVLEELQSHPIDATLCRLLGENGKLLVSCAVHWCTDASVIIEPGGGSYRFEGPDVKFGGRMWFFAAPNTVTLSNPAKETLGPGMANMGVTPFNSVNLRGVKGLQKLFVITDPGSKRLKDAAAVAAARIERAREAHRQLMRTERAEDFNLLGGASDNSGPEDSSNAIPHNRNLAATAFLCTPTSTSLSVSNTSEHLDSLLSTSSSVTAYVCDPQLLEGRTMMSRPRPPTGKTVGRSRFPPSTVVPPSSAAAVGSPATHSGGAASSSAGGDSPLIDADSGSNRNADGAAVEPPSLPLPCTPIAAPVVTSATATTTTSTTTTTHRVVRTGANPLLIAVPAGNPLNAPPRDGTAGTGTSSSLSTLGTGRRVSGSPGMPEGGRPPPQGGGSRGPRSSFASQEAAAVSLFNSLYDDGPLGDRRFQSTPTSGVAASASSVIPSFNRSTGVSNNNVSGTDVSDESAENEVAVIAHALLHPSIPVYMDSSLRAAYESQAFDVDISYDSVRVLIYYFFSSYKMLFRPLAAQERVNVYKRLTTAFGMPQQNILEQFAVRCALQYMKYHEAARTLLMGPVAGPQQEVRKKQKKRKKL